MENASKALLIAASVLVVIIIIAFGMRIYTSSQGTQKVSTDTGKTIADKTGDATDIAIEEITGKKAMKFFDSDGNSIEKKDVQRGCNIKIGTEEFVVFKVNDQKIYALAHHCIELKTNNPRQTLSAGKTTFSQKNYWGSSKNMDIPMTERDDNGLYKNNVQQYIDAYIETLKNDGVVNFDMRCPTNEDLNGNNPAYRINGIPNNYWVATSHIEYDNCIYCPFGGSSNLYWGFTSFSGEAYICPLLILPID